MQCLAQINFAYSVLADLARRQGYDIREEIDAAFVERRGQGMKPRVTMRRMLWWYHLPAVCFSAFKLNDGGALLLGDLK